MGNKKIGLFISIVVLVLALFGCSNDQTSQSSEKNSETGGEVNEGILEIAIPAQPPTLDPHLSTVTATRDISRHIYETLVAFDENYEPVPMLAESIETSEDGKTYTFHLRTGIKFHNGKEMTAEDVVASMERWKEKSTSAHAILQESTFSSTDNDTVVLQLEQPSILVLSALANTSQFAAVMPKEVIDSAPATGVEEYIGTGPFQFGEWNKDQNIKLTKYNEYQSVDLPTSGVSGKKEVFVSDVNFVFVPDNSTRLAGIQTGQYHVADTMSKDDYKQLSSNPDVNLVAPYGGFLSLVFNKKQGLFTDIKMRQAINAGVDMDSLLKGSLVEEYRANSSYILQEKTQWFSEAGGENYNQNDPEKSKGLLGEAGYNGEEITILTTRDYLEGYNAAVIIKEQLEKIGMNIKVEAVDWATVVSSREDPEKWDLLITGFPTVSTPVELLFFNEGFYDGPEDEKTAELLQSIKNANSIDESKVFWDELQAYSWEFLPIVKIGDYTQLLASINKVEGVTFFDGPVLWNTKLTK